MIAQRLSLLLCSFLLGASAHAQLSQIDMTDKEITKFLSGNTIAAVNLGPSSLEYHGPNGEAIWNENGKVQVGEYRVKRGFVCYRYFDPEPGNWYCWDFKRDRRTGEVYQWTGGNNSYLLNIYGVGDLTDEVVVVEEEAEDETAPANLGEITF